MRARLFEDLRGACERDGEPDLEALAREAERRGDQAYAAYVRAEARKASKRKPGARVAQPDRD